MWKRSVLTAVAASIVSTSAVFAQVPPDNTPPPPPPGREFGRGPAQAGRIAQRLREAHDRLGITPAQQPQWDALMATLRENARGMRANPAVQALRSGHLDAVQGLRAAAEAARARADAMQRTMAPLEALYAVLSPEQRQIADRDMNRLLHAGGPRRDRARG